GLISARLRGTRVSVNGDCCSREAGCTSTFIQRPQAEQFAPGYVYESRGTSLPRVIRIASDVVATVQLELRLSARPMSLMRGPPAARKRSGTTDPRAPRRRAGRSRRRTSA